MSENKYGYGFYTEEQLEDYYDELIGRLFNISSIFRITFLFLLQLHIFLRRLRQDSGEGDLHRCQEDDLPGGRQVRRQPRLER